MIYLETLPENQAACLAVSSTKSGNIEGVKPDPNDPTATTDSERPTKDPPESRAPFEDEEILEREPDGRYRIIGKRPRQQK